jgi:hypothetical protein
MIAFSLKNPVSHQLLIKKIDDLIRKEIKSQEQAQDSILVISIKTAIDPDNIKKINGP